MANPFKKATKEQARLRMAITGISGSGKTYSALNIAQHLVPGGKVAVIDTEHGSASKYADLFTFDVVELDNFSPDNYIAMINAATGNGYDVLIIDSLSHAWVGEGGVLDLVNKVTLASKSRNAYTEGWSKGTPAQNRLIDTIIAAPCHVIATMRSKSEYIMETDSRGKSSPKKVGMAAIQREGVEYEFDVVAEMNLEHTLIIEKTRCLPLDGGMFNKPGAAIAETLRAWLSDGAEPEPVADAVHVDETNDDPPVVVKTTPPTRDPVQGGTSAPDSGKPTVKTLDDIVLVDAKTWSGINKRLVSAGLADSSYHAFSRLKIIANDELESYDEKNPFNAIAAAGWTEADVIEKIKARIAEKSANS